MAAREGVAGTNFQVLLELRSAFPRFEGDTADKFPWPVLGRMEIGALVVALEPRPHVIGQADVGLLGLGQAPQQVDMMHGLAQRWLAMLLRQDAS